MNRKKLTIGLFGFGCVGYGLYQVLQRTPTLNATVKHVCVKHSNKQRPITSDHFTLDKYTLLRDEEINVIVELIDDADAAFEIVKEALRNGKAVVTANKKMVAEHFRELLELQRQYNVPLLYEAACCASIPIIRNLEEYYDNDLLQSVEGIVNGSTNYILTRTVLDGLTFNDALVDAQTNGYAETDPTLDICGFDAKFKLIILIAHAFGVVVKPETVANIGIDRLGSLEQRYAKEKGYKIKLVATASKGADGKIIAYVLPKFVSSANKLYNVDDVFNGIEIKSSFSDVQFFVGKGAGAFPTASAVLSDISALAYNYKYEYKKLNGHESIASYSSVLLKVLLVYDVEARSEIESCFESITESYCNQEQGYFIGLIGLHQLEHIERTCKTLYSAVLFEVVEDCTSAEHKVLEVESYATA